MVALLSSVIVTFLCLRLRKHKSSHNHDSLDVGHARHLRKNSDADAAYVIGGTSSDFRCNVRNRFFFVSDNPGK